MHTLTQVPLQKVHYVSASHGHTIQYILLPASTRTGKHYIHKLIQPHAIHAQPVHQEEMAPDDHDVVGAPTPLQHFQPVYRSSYMSYPYDIL